MRPLLKSAERIGAIGFSDFKAVHISYVSEQEITVVEAAT